MIAVFVSILAAFSLAIPDANTSLFLYEKFFTNDKKLQQAFAGKRVWITGATSGIGEEMARQLHGHGANLIISGRREGELNRVKKSCETTTRSDDSTSDNISVLPFDVTDSDEVLSTVVSKASQKFGGIDILILNAGAGQLNSAIDSPLSKSKMLMEVNYFGPMRLAMEVVKKERWEGRTNESKGHIVVTSSVASKMPLPLGTSYAASKFAVHGYFSSLRAECAEWLRIDLPCPGPIATAFQDKAADTNSDSAATLGDDDGEEGESELKMPVERCAKLIISGMLGPSSIMQETWISRQPTLFFLYLNQYLPTISNAILNLVGPLRLKAFKAGLPLYQVSSWLKAAKMEKENKSGSNNEESEPLTKSEL